MIPPWSFSVVVAAVVAAFVAGIAATAAVAPDAVVRRSWAPLPARCHSWTARAS